jgi:hypothetical protein
MNITLWRTRGRVLALLMQRFPNFLHYFWVRPIVLVRGVLKGSSHPQGQLRRSVKNKDGSSSAHARAIDTLPLFKQILLTPCLLLFKPQKKRSTKKASPPAHGAKPGTALTNLSKSIKQIQTHQFVTERCVMAIHIPKLTFLVILQHS